MRSYSWDDDMDYQICKPTFQDLADCLDSDAMDYFHWHSKMYQSVFIGDDCPMIANHLTVTDDVNFSPGPDTELSVLDTLKLEPPSPEFDNKASLDSDLQDAGCTTALSIAHDILQIIPLSEIDLLLRKGHDSEVDSDISEFESHLGDLSDLMQRSNDVPSCGPFRDMSPCGPVPENEVLSAFTLWRLDDSHMPIKKRRRSMESCTTMNETRDITRDPIIPSVLKESTQFPKHAPQLPRQCLFSTSSEPASPPSYQQISTVTTKKKPGRKPGQCSKGYHLWEFMRDLLLNSETCPRDVMWVDEHNGIFRICNSDRVAKLWGARKNNKKLMTYEKLSRALRFSRTAGYFGDLPKNAGYPRKLCFKFGPKTPYGQRNNGLTSIKVETSYS